MSIIAELFTHPQKSGNNSNVHQQFKCFVLSMKDKIWYLHTVEYYLLVKRNKGRMHTTTWINLENTKTLVVIIDHILCDSIYKEQLESTVKAYLEQIYREKYTRE